MAKFVTLASLLFVTALGSTAKSCTDHFNAACYEAANIIQRDVAIIGGGSSGTFAAITLKDMGKSLVVVEKQALLGGHVLTYTDPASGSHINYGVRLFENTTTTFHFFNRLNVSMVPFKTAGPGPAYIDFATGQALDGFAPSGNFTAYMQLLDKFPYLVAGNGFQLPNPVPEDLVMPFGDYINKYNLQDVAYSIWANPSLGDVGDIFPLPTAYVLKALSKIVLTQVSTPGKTLTSPNDNNHEAWTNAQAELGHNVLLSSTVIAARRSRRGCVRLVVQTPAGRKLIKASKVLFTAAQTLENLRPFSLDEKEEAVFSQLEYTGFYSGLVSGTGLSNTSGLQNAATKSESYHIPMVPNAMHFYPTGVPGIHSFWYESKTPLKEDEVKRDLVATIHRLSKSTPGNIEFIRFANHSPGILYAPAKQMSSGFWDQMNALQGHRSMYYTGLLFEPSASGIWAFTQDLIKRMDL